jgi:hypothetical protein
VEGGVERQKQLESHMRASVKKEDEGEKRETRECGGVKKKRLINRQNKEDRAKEAKHVSAAYERPWEKSAANQPRRSSVCLGNLPLNPKSRRKPAIEPSYFIVGDAASREFRYRIVPVDSDFDSYDNFEDAKLLLSILGVFP